MKKAPSKDPDKERRKIKSVAKMKEIMTTYYIEAKTAKDNGKKVAWITSGGPVEFLIAMDVIPVYPENHGAMIGASKMGVDLCEKAEEMGYSAISAPMRDRTSPAPWSTAAPSADCRNRIFWSAATISAARC
ncbi:MAG: hypothetical protein R2861_06490 [Desulfobacterales bacterium]